MKNLLNLNGAQKLSKEEQQSINGGTANCFGTSANASSCYCYNSAGWCFYVEGTTCPDGSQAICK